MQEERTEFRDAMIQQQLQQQLQSNEVLRIFTQ